MSLIQIRKLNKTYQAEEVETRALADVDLSVAAGEFVAIMGPSGCGKSTLLNILGMIDSPTSGDYSFMGEDVLHLGEAKRAALRKRHIGLVFQNFNLIEELSVFENVELPLMYLRLSPAERSTRVREVLEQMRILHRRNYYPEQLSGGQQQRVAVARAMVARPRLILADEPTGNLDSANGEDVLDLLSDLNAAGTTVVMVTHSPTYAERSHRIVHLFDGRIIMDNTLAETAF